MLLKIIIGLIGAVIGFYLVWKPQWFLGLLGELRWAEKVFGPNREMAAYQAIGVIVVLVSFLIMTGMIQNVILWIFSPIIRSGI